MSINHKRNLRAALMGSAAWAFMAAPVALAPSSAMAQDQAADDAAPVDQIVVTGSRIPRAGFDTVQPATVVDEEFFSIRGFDNAAQALNELPQFGLPAESNVGGQNSNNVGQNIVNLFGLGSQRTLTLINGRRTVGQNTPNVGSAASPGLQVDLNIIPTLLIDRVETIETGGAPIYGSDAISGTVNIILKDDFEGLQMDVQYGIDEKGDAENWRYRTLLGGNFADGRGNVVVNFEWTKQNALDARERPGLINSPAFVPNPLDTGPSDGIVDTLFMDDALNVWQVPNTGFLLLIDDGVAPTTDVNGNPTFQAAFQTLGGNPGVDILPMDANGNFVMLGFDGTLINIDQAGLGTPFAGAVSFFSQGADGANNPFVSELDELNTFVSPLERFTMNALGHYDLTDNIRIFYEGLYSRSESVDRSNQPPWSTRFFRNANNGALGNYRVNMTDNPFVGQEFRDLFELNGLFDPTLVDDPETADVDESDQFFFVSRSNIDIIGDSENFRDQDVYRFVVGADGDFSFMDRDWSWGVDYTFGQTNASTLQTVINGSRLSMATDVVLDADGNPACRVNVEGTSGPGKDGSLPGFGTEFDIANCTPINILNFGSISDEAKTFVLARQGQSNQLQQSVVQANITGNLFELPAGAVGFATGVTHRRERGSFSGSQGSSNGVAPNPPIAPVSGAFNTWEWYAETVIPLMTNGEGFGFLEGIISDWTLEGAVRVVDNGLAGTATTWTAGGRLTPDLLDGFLTFRGNFTAAIRSPAITELFLPQVTVGTFATDPCDQRDIESGNNPAVRRANCEANVVALAASLDPNFNLNNFRAISRNASQAAITGGNPDLKNESSKAFSVGGIFRPDIFVPGLELSVDYTQIEITDAIVNLSATNIMAACFDSPNFPNEAACSRFQRDPVTFQPSNFITGFVNAANVRFRGLTVQSSYNFELADVAGALDGNMRITFNYFHTFRNDQQVGAADRTFFDGGRGTEKDKFQANVTYNLDKITAFLQWRGDLGGLQSPNDTNAGNNEARDVDTFPAYHVFNFSLRYQVTDSVYIQGQVNNFLNAKNKLLRQAATGSNGNVIDDVFGRRYLFTAGASF